MKTLAKQFEGILHSPHITPDGKFGYEAVIIQLIQAVKERDAYIIGNDEEETGLDREEDFAINWINGEKAEQRKRAEESL